MLHGRVIFRGMLSMSAVIQGCMKVLHTLLNSVNPIRLSRNELDVSNHLIRIITLTRGIVLMNPLPWACLMLFIHEQTDRGISEPFGWYWWWDSNPHWTVPKTVASCRWATPAYADYSAEYFPTFAPLLPS